MFSPKSSSGVTVTEAQAFGYAAFYAAVRVIAESVAGLPLILYERDGERGRRRATEHKAYALLGSRPNEYQTAYSFRESRQVSLCTRGNAYAEILREGPTPVELLPLDASRVAVRLERGRAVYDIDGGRRTLNAGQMMHVQNLGSGLEGWSPLRLAREQIGQGIAADRHGARFFANAATPGGVLSYPGQFEDEEDIRRLRASVSNQASGDNAHKTLVLEEGMTWAPMSMPNDDAQWLESRRFSTEEIARIFRIPPHMIGVLDRATFSNIEHMGIEFVVHTLRPWLIRWEQELNYKLLEEEDRKRFYFEHLVEDLLRGDTETRFAAYATAIQNGYMTRNEVRQRENLEAMEGLDEFLVPLNLGGVSEQSPPEDEQDDDAERGDPPEVEQRTEQRADVQRRSLTDRQQTMASFRSVFEDAARRVINRETNQVRKMARRFLEATPVDTEGFLAWLRKYYTDTIPEFVRDAFGPAFAAYAGQLLRVISDELGRGVGDVDAFLDAYMDAFASRYSMRNRIRLEETVTKSGTSDLIGAVGAILLLWREKRAASVASSELVQLNGATSRVSYENAGVEKLVWVAVGSDTCPICDEMDGRVVGVREAFVQEGDSVAGGPEQGGIRASSTVRHPPIHDGCDCMIVAE
jgi:HK97 family phage portal protein